MKSERLIFPRGITLLTNANNELSGLADKLSEEEFERLTNADIRTGYMVNKDVENSGFSIYVEANVHAPHIWRVFTGLVKHLLPPESHPVLIYDENEPW